jgi:hypothetical protein
MWESFFLSKEEITQLLDFVASAPAQPLVSENSPGTAERACPSGFFDETREPAFFYRRKWRGNPNFGKK